MYVTPDMKGYLGERDVRSVLDLLKSDNFKYLYNAVIPRLNTVTQIDFMIFSTKVFACLEVKAWTGEIFIPVGNEKWRTVYGHQSISLHSPIDQNAAHVRAANNNSLYGINYDSYIVFPKNPVIHNKLINTGTLSDMVSYLVSSPNKYPQEFVMQEYNHFKQLTEENFSSFMEKEYMRKMKNKFEKTDIFGDDYD